MDKQSVIYTNNGTFFSLKKEWNSDTLHMSLENIMLRENKPDTKEKILYGSTYIGYKEQSNS